MTKECKADDSQRLKPLVYLLVLGLVGVAVYYPGLNIPYYNDDYWFVSNQRSFGIFYYFFHPNPFLNYTYRPVQASFMGMVQEYFGPQTWPIHLTQIAFHVLLSWLVYVFMVRQGLTRAQAILGSVFMLLSQANVQAVLDNDTLSQVIGAFTGCISLWLLHISSIPKGMAVSPGRPFRYVPYLYSVFFFIISILSKETSISFFILLAGIILVNNLKEKGRSSPIIWSMTMFIPYIAVMVLYFVIRHHLGLSSGSLGSGRMDFHIGTNIIKNLSLFIFAATLPVSSVTAFCALMGGKTATAIIILLSTSALIISVVYGLRRSGSPGMVFAFGVFTVVGMFPVVFMNHVSELYVYNFMPFVAVLVGMALGRLLEISRAAMRGVFTALLCLLFASNISAVQAKASLMDEAGHRFNTIIDQLKPYLNKSPENGEIVLLNPPADQVSYSEFKFNGFDSLKYVLPVLKQMSGREDITLMIINQPDLEQVKLRDGTTILTLEREKIRVYEDGAQNTRGILCGS